MPHDTTTTEQPSATDQPGFAGRESEALTALAGEAWRPVPTTHRMADGTVLRTYGVQATCGAWIGKVHPFGKAEAEQAAARRHAMMFAASREMGHLLREAVDAFAAEFEAGEPLSGADVMQWHALWRERAKVALRRAGLRPPRDERRPLARLKVSAPATAYVPPTGKRLREILGEATASRLHVSIWDFRRTIADDPDHDFSITCARIVAVGRRILRQRREG